MIAAAFTTIAVLLTIALFLAVTRHENALDDRIQAGVSTHAGPRAPLTPARAPETRPHESQTAAADYTHHLAKLAAIAAELARPRTEWPDHPPTWEHPLGWFPAACGVAA